MTTAAAQEDDDPPPALPLRPIKRARTAYFIFMDDKRAEVSAQVSASFCHVLYVRVRMYP